MLLTALSPIPVLYATFGRPHTLLFAWLMWGTVLALRARRTRATGGWWIAAGALLGLSRVRPSDGAAVRVHGVRRRARSTRRGRRARSCARRGRARSRCSSRSARTTSHAARARRPLRRRQPRAGAAGRSRAARCGRTRCTSSRRARHDVNYFTVLAAGRRRRARASQRRGRVLAFCAITVAAPVAVLLVRPGERRLGALLRPLHDPRDAGVPVARRAPACLAVARWAGGCACSLVVGCSSPACSAVELRYDAQPARRRNGDRRRRRSRRRCEHEPAGTVLFGSTGTSGAFFSSFDYGHPANLLDHYVALRVPSLDYVDDDSCERALEPFVRGDAAASCGAVALLRGRARRGRGGAAGARRRARRAVHSPAATSSCARARALAPRALVALGQRLRLAWRRAVPLNRRVERAAAGRPAARCAAAVCTPYGELGDPGISPHWPPVKTTHQ